MKLNELSPMLKLPDRIIPSLEEIMIDDTTSGEFKFLIYSGGKWVKVIPPSEQPTEP